MPRAPAPSLHQPPAHAGEVRAMLRLAVPMALANVLQMAVYAIDVVFVARLGQQALAAASLGVSLYAILMMGFSALTGALAPLVAAELGRGGDPRDEIRRTMRMALWIALACGLAGMAICGWGRAIMLALGEGDALASRAGAFLRVLRWAMLPMIMANALRNYVSAMGRPVFATAITALAILVNAAGNYALVFGHWRAPALGLVGSATASCITGALTLAAYALAIRLSPALHAARILARWWRPDGQRLARMLAIGVPIALTVVAEGGLFCSAAFLMGLIGEAQLAGHTVALQIASIAFQVPFGIGQAATIRVGYHFGAGDRAAIGRAGWTALALGIGFAVVNASLMLGAPRLFLALYVDTGAAANARLVGFAVRFLAVAAAFQLADGVQTIAAGALRGLQDTRVPMAIALFGYWAAGMGTAVVLGFGTSLGGLGIWIGLAVGLIVVAVLMLWRWHRRESLGL